MNFWTRLFTRLHLIIYQLTRGYLGNRVGKQSALILYTIGRHTKKLRSTTLSYYRDGNNYLVVASNWGEETHPDWYYNLMKNSCATIQVKEKRLQVEASLAQGEEYDRLWQLVTHKNKQYIAYQQRINRKIPVIILKPLVMQKDCGQIK
jgi:deazaflavin-dependent oxidoreductase (nitroreductase family)